MPTCFCLQGNVWKIKIQTVRQVVSLHREGLMLNEVWIHKCLESPNNTTFSKQPPPSSQPVSQFVDTSCSSPSCLLGHAFLPVYSMVSFSSLLLPSPSYLFQKKDSDSMFQLAFPGEKERDSFSSVVTEVCWCFHYHACEEVSSSSQRSCWACVSGFLWLAAHPGTLPTAIPWRAQSW